MQPSERVAWVDPPRRQRREEASVHVARILIQLRERPGQWALVHNGGGYGVSRRSTLLREAGCETTSAANPEGGRDLYARLPASAGTGGSRMRTPLTYYGGSAADPTGGER